VLTVHNFSYGLLTPVLAYIMSCLGAFIALRCTTRAFAHEGKERARWLLLAAVPLGITGIWVMHFIAMLGYTIPGQIIHYNIPITIFSMLIAVIVVAGGLLIVGFRKPNAFSLLLAGLITGIGVASMHYSGMMAMEVRGSMSYRPTLFGASIVIAFVASTAALWAAVRLRGLWHTLGAALIMGVAVSGMHYTGMAAMQMDQASGAGMSMSGPTAVGFLLPLIVGIGIISIVLTGALVFSPTSEEIREDAELMARINAATAHLSNVGSMPLPAPPREARWPGAASGPPSRNGSPAGGGSPARDSSPASHGSVFGNGTAGPNGAGYPGAAPADPAGQQNGVGRRRRLGRVSGQPGDAERRSLSAGRPLSVCRPPSVRRPPRRGRPQWAGARQRTRRQPVRPARRRH
jgi:NO-binding membrane sensor protein with MHYT domain